MRYEALMASSLEPGGSFKHIEGGKHDGPPVAQERLELGIKIAGGIDDCGRSASTRVFWCWFAGIGIPVVGLDLGRRYCEMSFISVPGLSC
jgi:hypothetical protein